MAATAPLATERILITGATGNVGLETLRELMKRPDASTRTVLAGVRDMAVAKTKIEVQPDAFVYVDFAFAGSFDGALAGISRVLLVRPPELADVDQYFKPFVAAMKRAGVKQVVFLSLQGVENNPVTPHHKIEKLLVEAGLPFVFLRPSFFMQNLSTTHRSEIRDRNEIFVPAGHGKTSFVDVRDVGAVAALVLSSPVTEHLNRGYELTGSEALSYGEVANILSSVLGRKITYRNPSVVRFNLAEVAERNIRPSASPSLWWPFIPSQNLVKPPDYPARWNGYSSDGPAASGNLPKTTGPCGMNYEL